MDDLKESIKMWYNLDKRIDELNLQLSTMRDKKKELEQNVIVQMKKQGLHNKKLNIGPISIIYSTSMQLPPYNLELIEDVLDKLYNKGSPQSIQFLQTLHANRENNRKPNNCIKKRKNRSTKKRNRKPSQSIPPVNPQLQPQNALQSQPQPMLQQSESQTNNTSSQ